MATKKGTKKPETTRSKKIVPVRPVEKSVEQLNEEVRQIKAHHTTTLKGWLESLEESTTAVLNDHVRRVGAISVEHLCVKLLQNVLRTGQAEKASRPVLMNETYWRRFGDDLTKRLASANESDSYVVVEKDVGDVYLAQKHPGSVKNRMIYDIRSREYSARNGDVNDYTVKCFFRGLKRPETGESV